MNSAIVLCVKSTCMTHMIYSFTLMILVTVLEITDLYLYIILASQAIVSFVILVTSI